MTADLVVLTVRDGTVAVLAVVPRPPLGGAGLALPSALMRTDEGLGSAAERALREATGSWSSRLLLGLVQVGIYSTPDRVPGSRTVTVAYLAIVPQSATPVASAAMETTWVTVDGSLMDSLVWDHGEIVADALRRARQLLKTTTVAAAFCGEVFTMSDLRRVYEVMWSTSLDQANFAHAIATRPGFAIDTGQRVSRGQGRSARLYRRGEATALRPPLYLGLPD